MPPYLPIEVEFRLEMRDVFPARLEVALWNKYLVVWIPILLGTGYLVIAPFMGISQLNGRSIDPVGASIPWVLFFLAYPACIYVSTRSFLKTSKASRSRLRYVFSEGNVEVTGDGTSSEFSWSNVHKARETRTALLLYLSSAVFLVIPKRCLADSQTLDALRNLIRSHVSGKVKVQNS